MIPHPWAAFVLALAAYRLTRLAGWDDFPLAARVRAWVIGERWLPLENVELTVVGTRADDRHGPGTITLPAPGPDLDLPGKQPSSEVEGVRPAYDRPTLAHLVHCPFCVGWWISLAVYLGWLWEPRWALYAAFPLAVSGFVGIVSKNLDA